MPAIAILSWKYPEILERTILSYNKQKLFDLFDEKLLVLQEATETDIKIARKYNIPYVSTKKNIGIENAWRMILETVKSEQILILENDCPLIETSKESKKQIQTAIKLLSKKSVDIVRLRSCKQPGEKFETIKKYKNFYQTPLSLLKRIIRPIKAKRLIGSSIYALDNPDITHPNEIKKFNSHCFITNSAYINWTNQSVMFNKSFVKEVLLERVKNYPNNRTVNGFQDIERALNCRWWRINKFPVAVCKGLFTHSRN
ncbi:MAG: hypothetical protein K0T99_02650 [Alphaproteobacteria bacterium]|nr:hypothetical protein [Alphaproteobacteria bacterium]